MKRNDHQLIQRVLDGNIRTAEFKEFQQRLRREPELLALYRDYALLHHMLSEEYEMLGFRSLPRPRPTPWWIVAGSVAAAAAVLMISLHFLGNPTPSTPGATPGAVAHVIFSQDASWEIDGRHQPVEGGVELTRGGTVRLGQGQAKWTLASSATAVINGPAVLTYEAEDRLMLHEGAGRFRMDVPGGKFEVATPSMTAVDLGTEFALEVREGAADELHVIEGKVRLLLPGKTTGPVLLPGEAGRVTSPQSIERFPAEDARFARRLSEFESVASSPFDPEDWRMDHGEVELMGSDLAGRDFMAFMPLPETLPSAEKPILLATMRVEQPASGLFHSEGWSGMSFYSGDRELLFFGDSHGPEVTWSIDVKQGQPVVLPGRPLAGPREVTLRYNFDTGRVTLHEGSGVLPPPFCAARIPPGTRFDRIRLGASAESALHVSSFSIRMGNSAH